jgi:hypothetical protein
MAAKTAIKGKRWQTKESRDKEGGFPGIPGY